MHAVLPDRQGDPPFLQARAEILGSVDRIEYRHPTGPDVLPGDVAFLGNQRDVGQTRTQKVRNQLFLKQVGLRHRAAIGLPVDFATQRQCLVEIVTDQRPTVFQQG